MTDPALAPDPPSAAPPDRGALLSEHPHPHPLLRRLTALLMGAGLVGLVVGVVGLLVAAIGFGLPLMALMAVFLAVLGLPLLVLTVLHPQITVYERGLWLQPLIGRGVWLAWDASLQVADHTLIRRGASDPRQRSHEGHLIVVAGDDLPRIFSAVGLAAGLGRARAFGIADHAHQDYTVLLNAIQKHKRRR